MECKNGQKYPTPADIFSREIEWKRRNAYARGLQLAFAARLPFPFPAQAMRIHQYNLPVFPPPMPPATRNREPSPFMNMMDEISYWVTTKRAPCLLNYDNVIKRQNEQAHCSKDTLKSTPNAEVSQPKSKKRKLKLLNESESSEKQQNVFFDKSLSKNIKAPKSLQSDSLASSIDFKIKPAVQRKPKKPKVQKRNKEVPKINKVCTSTPNTNLRRSLRKVRQTNNNYSQLNDSFEILNASAITAQDKLEIKVEPNEKTDLPVHNKNETNGNYEDSSDVSGFTANYIRSTKVHSSKTATKVQSKGNRNQVKIKKNANDNILLYVNKSANTGNPTAAVLNCSTDSSQNIINLVTVEQDATNNVDKSTSQLKFVNIKNTQELDSQKNIRQRNTVANHEASFQSRSSNASRYPTRQRKVSIVDSERDALKVNASEKATKANMPKESKSERKENSANTVSKTRSGRRIGADADPEVSACTRLNVDNSGEPVSSSPTLNVGGRRSRKSNSLTPRSKSHRNNKKDLCDESEKNVVGESSCVQLRSSRRTRQVTKANNVSGQLSQKDSLRDKSGFATCFTDSDSDDEPLKQRKFFC
ncbi:uncharacterized protein LOC121739750 [Aricia agestis]|uniref:uncharacterized protein LOC121739750 n=1 Tax=Aricia agestis TaxID=91739 RepID=UPI001C205773|nr:uncharacterized protein LOC121739750 [Aricia agestis]